MKKLATVATAVLSVTILAAVALFTFGDVTLVSTRGISMQPQFRHGDLAVLRSAPAYGVGDVVSYRSDELETVVMHRIVAVDGDRYTFQGDNNDWLDSEQPARDQLVGKLAFRIPHGGVWMDRVTSPGAVAAIAFLLLGSGGATAALTRRDRRKKRGAVKPTPLPPALRRLPPPLGVAGGIVAALAVASIALGAVSWSLPLTSPSAAPTTTNSNSTVTFSYRATVRPSAAYDGTTVSEPQPVFRKLTDAVDLEFLYESDDSVSAGTVRVDALLSTANGWTSTIPLSSTETFTGTNYTGRVRLVLSELQGRADAAAKAIGAEPAGDVSIIVVPEFDPGDGATFTPELPFTMSTTALRLSGEEPELVLSHSAPSERPAFTRGEHAATLTALGRSVLVSQARTAAAAGLGTAALAAFVLALLVRRAHRAPEATAIQIRYSQLLLPVEPLALPVGRPVVEVPDIGALVRLAERYGLFVMNWERGGTHTYVVLDDQTSYRYRSSAGTAQVDDASPEAAPLADQLPGSAP